MLDWDDLRFFLVLSEAGSVRSASADLGVSHSTVSRRIEQLEEQVGTTLFDRTPEGFRLTDAGTGIISSARRISDEVNSIERQVAGEDARLSGRIRVTMPDIAATHIFMDDFAEFTQRYPDIELELEVSYDVFDLSRREADLAIRIIRKPASPPENLIGRMLTEVYGTAYATPEYLERTTPDKTPERARWLSFIDPDERPDWLDDTPYPDVPAWGRMANLLVQVAACKAGLGMSLLPCVVGDSEPGLVRVDSAKILNRHEIWLLSHPDLRNTARIRVLREFIVERMASKEAAIRGGEK